MPNIETKIPSDLFLLQKWFASIITRPIDSESQMMPISPSGRHMSEEAKEFILPNLKLSSDQRIEIYNQQYWWRLLSILHQNFPTLTRLFGYTDFNQTIGMPFLTKFPSSHWSLSKLGDNLSTWINEYYSEKDKDLIYHTAELDYAYQSLFFAPPPAKFPLSLNHYSKKLNIQPHLKLFNLPFDLFSLRSSLLKEEVDFWTEAAFPVLLKEKNYFFLLYRTQNNLIAYKEVEEGQWTLLQLISTGLSIEETCDILEKEGGVICAEAEASLQLWIHEWIKEKWLMPIL